jgi:hypothetical protein
MDSGVGIDLMDWATALLPANSATATAVSV